jgi:hypothetical protein
MRYLTTADGTEWQSCVDRLPEHMRDVHYLPGMMSPYQVTGRGIGRLLVQETSYDSMILPVLTGSDGIRRHPYNFGGPAGNCYFFDGSLIDEFTPSPFFPIRGNCYPLTYDKESVWVNLAVPNNFRPTTRHMIEKSRVEVEEQPADSGNIAYFAEMYKRTMERVGAASHWLFDKVWFEALLTAMKDNTALLFARAEGRFVAGCILLYGYDTCYFHFSANVDRPIRGASHKMVAAAIDWARAKGLKRFHLGGGVKANDGLFLFKSGFSDLRLPVYRYKRSVECRVAS